MTIGVIGMEFFQLAGEMGSACVSRAAVGVPPNARCGSGSQRDIANGDRDGRAPHFELIPVCVKIKNLPVSVSVPSDAAIYDNNFICNARAGP